MNGKYRATIVFSWDCTLHNCWTFIIWKEADGSSLTSYAVSLTNYEGRSVESYMKHCFIYREVIKSAIIHSAEIIITEIH